MIYALQITKVEMPMHQTALPQLIMLIVKFNVTSSNGLASKSKEPT